MKGLRVGSVDREKIACVGMLQYGTKHLGTNYSMSKLTWSVFFLELDIGWFWSNLCKKKNNSIMFVDVF